jgi:hypothetical protein
MDPISIAIGLIIPIGIIIVIWIAVRSYLEYRENGFLAMALAFMLPTTTIPLMPAIISLLPDSLNFEVISWFTTGQILLSLGLIAYGLWRISSKAGITKLRAREKLSLSRQLALFAGVTMIIAAFMPWFTYEYDYTSRISGGHGSGGAISLIATFLLPNTLQLKQININTLMIGATIAGLLFLIAGLGCTVKDAKWSPLSVAGIITFLIAYVQSLEANLAISTGIFTETLEIHLSSGLILGILGTAIGITTLIGSIKRFKRLFSRTRLSLAASSSASQPRSLYPHVGASHQKRLGWELQSSPRSV